MTPNFVRDAKEGQLTVKERKMLYNAILEVKPETVFEVGTWKGGGSTYIISCALETNKCGKLYTVEIDQDCFKQAFNLYQTEFINLKPYVLFHIGNSLAIYPHILKDVGQIDFLLLDGQEDRDQTLLEYNMFKPYLRHGALIFCHDWYTEKMVAVKPSLFKDCYTLAEVDGPTGMGVFEYV